jgi:hypothetical protein
MASASTWIALFAGWATLNVKVYPQGAPIRALR